MITASLYLTALLLACFASQVIGAPAATFNKNAAATTTGPMTPEVVFQLLGDRVLQQPLHFFPPDEYGSALLYQGMYECLSAFGGNKSTEGIIGAKLDNYIKLPGLSPYIALHNSSFIYDSAIGDEKGLFPVAYLERAVYSRNLDTNSTDIEIAQKAISKFITSFPRRLGDGTIAREDGGSVWPRSSVPEFVWGDDQFMGLTLVSRVGSVLPTPAHAAAVQFAADQETLFQEHMQDTNDGLYFHGSRTPPGGSNEFTCCKWGRANGWGMMSHVEVLAAIDSLAARNISIRGRSNVLRALTTHAEGVKASQAPDGRWHQVMDNSTTYLETSATAMNVFALARAVINGWLTKTDYEATIRKGWAGLSSTIDADGTVNGICSGTGFEKTADDYNKRPTSFESSLNGGLGAVLRAAAAMTEFDLLQ